jgi:putative endonuclease
MILSSPGLTGRPSIPEALMGARIFYVYILANHIGGTLYIGVTNDLVRRVFEHKSSAADSFTKRHDVNRLVYFECFDEIEQAIHREKRLKKWTRAWKISLIEKDNPDWIDLYPQIAGG